jgi:hypothetical protein
MKIKIISSIALVALTGVFLTALALSGSDETPSVLPGLSAPAPPLPATPSAPPSAEPAPSSPAAAAETEGFWIRELDGYIAVYHNTKRDTPIEISETAVWSLRLADQEMLKEGVFFEDYMDVVVFLEDFAP